jgi:hypothetical protein
VDFKEEVMTRRIRTFVAFAFAATLLLAGCESHAPKYGTELQLAMHGLARQTWAVAPTIDLSGENIDPLLQSDIVFDQLQQVHGLTVIPVNRVIEVFASLKISQIQSEEQAAVVCDLLGCDAIVVPTITLYDPYDPPKVGASLQLFQKSASFSRPEQVNPQELARQAAPELTQSLPATGAFVQAVGVFDAANGSTREAMYLYADGRQDPTGPLGKKEYLVDMDRYCGFAYTSLIRDLLFRMGSK